MSFNSNATGGGYGYLGGANYLTSSFRIEAFATGMEDFKEAWMERFGDENQGIMELVNATGGSRAVTSYQYGHAEGDWMRKNVTVANVTGTGTESDSMVITAIAADKYEVPTTSNNTFYKNHTTKSALPVRENDVLQTANGAKVKVISIDLASTAFTVKSLSGSAVTVTGDDVLPVLYNMYPEGSGHKEGLDRGLLNYRNQIQIIKNQYSVTGTQAGQIGYVSYKGNRYFYVKGMEDTKHRHFIHKENALLVGEKIEITSSDFEDTAATEGLIPFMEKYGNVQDYSGSISLSDIDAGLEKLTKFRGVTDLAGVMSQSRLVELQDMLRDLGGLQNGGINYGASAQLVNLGFKGFERGRYKLNFNTLAAFDDPFGVGASSKYQDMVLFLPIGKTTVHDYGTQVSESRAYMSVVHQSVDGEVNGDWEGVEGGVLNAKTNLEDKITIGLRSRIGFEGACPNKFLLLQKTGA